MQLSVVPTMFEGSSPYRPVVTLSMPTKIGNVFSSVTLEISELPNGLLLWMHGSEISKFEKILTETMLSLENKIQKLAEKGGK